MLWMSWRKAVLPSTFFQYYWPPDTMQVAKTEVIGKRSVLVDCLALTKKNTLQLNRGPRYLKFTEYMCIIESYKLGQA